MKTMELEQALCRLTILRIGMFREGKIKEISIPTNKGFLAALEEWLFSHIEHIEEEKIMDEEEKKESETIMLSSELLDAACQKVLGKDWHEVYDSNIEAVLKEAIRMKEQLQ